MSEHQGLPIPGYRPQSETAIKVVGLVKEVEERILRALDELATQTEIEIDKRWLAIGRTSIEQGFMAVNRSIFRPERIALPDEVAGASAEGGWLIEDGSSPVSAPTYLAGGAKGMRFTTDHLAAIRFARKEDAEAVALFAGVYSAVRIAFHEWG